MSRERELLRECLAFIKNWRETGSPIGYNDMASDISAILSPPEAGPSKTIYGVLATAYRPSQHEASMAAVARHKGDTPESDYVLGAKEGAQDKGLPVVMRSLERQRDELRAENAALAKHALAVEDSVKRIKEKAAAGHKDHPFCPYCNPCRKSEELAKLRAENEELRNRWLATDGCISIPTTRYRELIDCLEAVATGKGNCDWRSVLNEHRQMLECNNAK